VQLLDGLYEILRDVERKAGRDVRPSIETLLVGSLRL
jgi:hypothetical protein